MPIDEKILIRTLEPLGSVRTGAEFVAWVGTKLQGILPHGAFVCGIGRIHSGGVAPVKYLASNFPPEYVQALKQSNGLYSSPVLKRWLASGEVQLLDGEAAVCTDLDSAWLERFKASGLRNIAAHGVMDFSRQYASYFSFHRIPELLGERHRWLLEFIVPHLHGALLRVFHKSGTAACATRTGSALTAREFEVLSWVCEGKTSAEIAAILGVARNTVRNQSQSILVKMQVNTRSQAAAKAIETGLIVPCRQVPASGKF